MFGRSFKICTISGVPVHVHWAFVVLIAYRLLSIAFVSGSGRGGTGDAVIGELIWLGTLVLTVVLHEMAHALTGRSVGWTPHKVVLWPLGGWTELSDPYGGRGNPWRSALVSLSGPGVNLAVSGILGAGVILSIPALEAGWSGTIARHFVRVNLFIGLLNLIPAQPLDGGQALRRILQHRFGFARGDLWAGRVGIAGAVALGIIALHMHQPMLVFLAVLCGALSFQLVRGAAAAAVAGRQVGRVGPDDGRVWRLAKEELDDELERKRRANRANADMRRRVDAILKKVSEQGLDALSEDERRYLQEASRKMRER
jgi:Zn-dependent protease